MAIFRGRSFLKLAGVSSAGVTKEIEVPASSTPAAAGRQAMTKAECEEGLQPLVPAMIDAMPLIGMRIQLERTIDVPCCVCGHTMVVIGQGAGTHVASLNCASCKRHRGWLTKTVADFLLEMISLFGRPTDSITIRNSEFAQSESAAPSGAPAAANISHPEPDNERN